MNETTIQNLMQQAQQAQQALNKVYADRGLTYDAVTKTAKPIKPIIPGKISTSITTDEIANTKPFQLPPPTPQNTQTDLRTLTNGAIQNYAPVGTPVQTEQDKIKLEIANLIQKQGTQSQVTSDVYAKEGVNNKEQLAKDLTTKYEKTQKEYQKIIDEIKSTGGGLASGQDTEIRRIETERDSRLADIAIDQKKAVGDYESAFKIAEAKIKAEFGDIDKKLQGLNTMYSLLQDDMTESEKLKAQQAYKEQDDLRKFQYDLRLKQEENKIKNTGVDGGSYATDLDAIIGSITSIIPTKFGQQQFQAQMAKARNDADRVNLVAAQVLKGAPSEIKTDFINQSVGIKEIEKAIAELDNGAQTGLFNNSLQYTFNLAGKDFDPKLAKINSYLTAAIQPYRNSVTGAAWGEQEDGEYQSLFGSTKYSPTELRQRLVTVKELLKSKSVEGLNAFVNPLGNYANPFEVGTLAPGGSTESTVFDEVAGQSGGYWSNLWGSLWGN